VAVDVPGKEVCGHAELGVGGGFVVVSRFLRPLRIADAEGHVFISRLEGGFSREREWYGNYIDFE
jgi:hypothetical protein